MFVLDTNVVSELRKPHGKAHARVLDWSRTVAPVQLFLSAITIFEIELGLARLEHRDPDSAGLPKLRAWLQDQVLAAFEGRILPVDVMVARRSARLHLPNPVSERDAMIAASALVHGFTVVTRNVADFARTGVTLLNPWD